MKRYHRIRILVFTLVTLTLANFERNNQPILSSATLPTSLAQTATASNIFLPLVKHNYASPIVPNTTNVLTDDTLEQITSISNDGAVFTFNENTSQLADVQPGEIIVGDVSAAAPSGFLRKVTGVTSASGQTVVTTQAATLEEAIQQATIQIRKQLTPSDVATAVGRSGVTLQSTARSTTNGSFFIDVEDVVLYDDDKNLETTDDQVKANGSLELSPDFDFNIRISDWKLQELTIVQSTTKTAELEIVVEASNELIDKEIELARFNFSPFTIFVGFVPVVFQPVLTVHVGLNGAVHVGVTTSVTQETTVTAGLHYADGNWETVRERNNSFDFVLPTLSAGLEMKGYAGSQLSIFIYGVTGPHVKVNAFLELEVDLLATPWWELHGGLEVPVGVEFDILGRELADYETVAIGYRVLLAQAEVDADLPSGQATIFDAFFSYGQSGFDFDNNAVVAWNGGSADILASRTQTGSPIFFFLQHDEAPFNNPDIDKDARSGIVEMSQTSADQVSECPVIGYDYHWVEAKEGSVYCVRTRDGDHYAVIELTAIRTSTLSFSWIYQPDGSRNFR